MNNLIINSTAITYCSNFPPLEGLGEVYNCEGDSPKQSPKKQRILDCFASLAMMLIITFHAVSYSQSSCPNLDFSIGDFTNWQAYCGTWAALNPCLPSNRHVIMNAQQLQTLNQLYDEYCNMIPKVPNGFNYAVRLGNANTATEREALKYTLTIDSTNALLIVYTALILGLENAPSNHVPRFTIQIRNNLEIPLNLACSDMAIIAETIHFNLCGGGGVDFAARNWTRLAFNLSPFIGQTITLYIETRDCALGSHAGYAYVVADCRPAIAESVICDGSVARLYAPEGFESYKWTRSSDTNWVRYTSFANVPNPPDNEIFTCNVTSFGCATELKYIIKKIRVIADFSSKYDTCTRTATFVDFSQVHNTVKDSILWEISKLNVRSKDSLFTYTFPEPTGNQPDTYKIILTVFENECMRTDTISQYITVYPTPKVIIDTDKQICKGDTATFTFTFTGTSPWELVYTENNGLSYDTIKSSVNICELKVSPTDTTVYKFIEVSDSRCPLSLTENIQIDVLTIPTQIFSNDTLCNGDRTNQVVFTKNFTNYQWASDKPLGNIPITPQTVDFGKYEVLNKTPIPETATITLSGEYLFESKACSGSTYFSITVLPDPTLTNVFSNDTLCSGNQINAIVFEGNANVYEWMAKGNVLGIPTGMQMGDFEDYIVENNTKNTLVSTITVTPKYIEGSKECEGIRQHFEIRVNPTTKIESIVTNSKFFCEGDELKIEVIASGEDIVYQWYLDGNILFGEQDKELFVSPVLQSHSGKYSVEVSGVCGREKSQNISIDASGANVLVEKWHDVILVDNSSRQFVGYQWYRDEILLSGATEQFYQEVGGLNGCYSVELRLATNGSIRSCQRCAYKTRKEKFISVYPNPAINQLTINNEQLITGNIEIYDIVGKLLQSNPEFSSGVNLQSEITIDVSHLANGLYFLKIDNKVVKFMKE